jgi:hydroxymethylpyrimidine/phosphomethylpyrimidine kinase
MSLTTELRSQLVRMMRKNNTTVKLVTKKKQALRKNNNPCFALTVAGSDSGGGAGIQADLKAFAHTGAFGLSAITAITAQNSRAVEAVFPSGATAVTAQLICLARDFSIGAAKTGMLVDAEIVSAVANFFRMQRIPLIVDPVMIASSGAQLLSDRAIDSYLPLLQLAELITPNLPEATVLLKGFAIESKTDMQEAARRLIKLGARAILLKGGHAEGSRCWDLLQTAGKNPVTRWFSSSRLDVRGHGTGCTLSALITAHRARGLPLEDAVSRAINTLRRALRSMPKIGLGKVSTPDPFFGNYRPLHEPE